MDWTFVTSWATYSTPEALLARHGLQRLGAGEFHGRSKGFRQRRLESHALVFISSGRGSYVDAALGTVEVIAPSVLSIFPRRDHGYWSSSGWSEHWLLVQGISVTLFEALGALDRADPVRRFERIPESLPHEFEALRLSLREPGWDGRIAASIAAQRVLRLALGHAVQANTSLAAASAVQAEAAQDISLAERARRLGLSSRTLRRRIAEATGSTPLDLVIRTRVERAGDLLSGTDMSIQDIGRSVGYDDAAYFSRVFTARMGVSPSLFRSQHRRST